MSHIATQRLRRYSSYVACVLALAACDPDRDDSPALGDLPTMPAMSVEMVPGETNRVIVRDNSEGYFARIWDFPGGVPATSTLPVDTVFYPTAGDYEISLHLSAESGSGTVSAASMVEITEDAAVRCSSELELLLGGCEEGSQKCWTFSQAAGAISVGPFPGSSEWFTSTESSLQAEQYDDAFCFSFGESRFEYKNSGLTVDPWNGYVPVPFDPPTDLTWQLIPQGGVDGETRIVLPDGAFMGVWDAGTTYDIVTLTETELVVRTPFLSGADQGWFELYFVAL